MSGARTAGRVLVQLAIAVGSLCLLLAIYFFWLLLPLAGILLYVVVQYAFTRRRRRQPLQNFRLAHESEARAADIKRRSGRR